MIYKIPVSWEMYGYLLVEAESLEQAVTKAEVRDELPDKGEYVLDSFTVDAEVMEELNNG